ncbi:MAG: DUF6448 family protein, partial [Acidobacteriota bacterium]
DGPVVQAARAALEKDNVSLVLRWVQPEREAEIRAAFARTRAVRALGTDARELADMWFFETLVRIHRQGEGAAFEGLKPAGHIEPFAIAVDRSLASGSVADVVRDVIGPVQDGIRQRFERARETSANAGASVAAGRAHVAAYVDYLHYVEGLLKAAGNGAGERQETTAHKH